MRQGGRLLRSLESLIARHSLIGDRPIFEPTVFPWSAALEAGWMVIRTELERVLELRNMLPSFQDISRDQMILTQDDQWKTFFLFGMGNRAKLNCALCPETTRLVEQIPGMMTAFFSILGPGKHIPPHRGLFKGLIRYHLGLLVPEPAHACRIRVDDQIVHWEEGKSLVFDDTYEHEVWNETSGQRVVLFLDVLRPLPTPLALLNQSIIKMVSYSPYVQDARKNFQDWEKKLEVAHPGLRAS